MAFRPTRPEYLGALTLAMWGCATPPPTSSTATPTPDPFAVAQTWARQCTGRLAGGPGCAMSQADNEPFAWVSSWSDAQVLRAYFEGGKFHAVVAEGTSDTLRQAVVLTLTQTQGDWLVSTVEAGQTDLLWPAP